MKIKNEITIRRRKVNIKFKDFKNLLVTTPLYQKVINLENLVKNGRQLDLVTLRSTHEFNNIHLRVSSGYGSMEYPYVVGIYFKIEDGFDSVYYEVRGGLDEVICVNIPE